MRGVLFPSINFPYYHTYFQSFMCMVNVDMPNILSTRFICTITCILSYMQSCHELWTWGVLFPSIKFPYYRTYFQSFACMVKFDVPNILSTWCICTVTFTPTSLFQIIVCPLSTYALNFSFDVIFLDCKMHELINFNIPSIYV